MITELGVTLKSLDKLHKAKQNWENQSIIEDSENHFHVDWMANGNNKMAFMLGVKTLTLLAEKFQKEKVNGIRFWYSFRTPELGEFEAKQKNLDKDGDQYFISDRLSFYKRRKGEEVISTERIEDKYVAILIIEI